LKPKNKIIRKNKFISESEKKNSEPKFIPSPGKKIIFRKWKSFLREFVMLFLAVFLGFLAQYYLSHKIEEENGKQFVKSLREDLCKDKVIIQDLILYFQNNISAADSLVLLINKNKTVVTADIKKMYEYNLSSLAGFSLILTDRTSSQLKNAGGMRMVSDKNVADAIIEYWGNQSNISATEETLQKMRFNAREKSYLIFNNKYYGNSKTSNSVNRNIIGNAQLMTNENAMLTEFGNRLSHIKNLMNGTYTNMLKKQITLADSVIHKIDKYYDLNY
jgi:hypothetical protein